jgi:hypothetical protein
MNSGLKITTNPNIESRARQDPRLVSDRLGVGNFRSFSNTRIENTLLLSIWILCETPEDDVVEIQSLHAEN